MRGNSLPLEEGNHAQPYEGDVEDKWHGGQPDGGPKGRMQGSRHLTSMGRSGWPPLASGIDSLVSGGCRDAGCLRVMESVNQRMAGERFLVSGSSMLTADKMLH